MGHRTRSILIAAAAVSAAVAAVALAGGGPPPASVPPDPAPFTVVATGLGTRAVGAPRRQTDASIQRAVRVARRRVLPLALAAARAEAADLGAAAGLTPGRVVGVRRDVSPLGFNFQDEGVFGPGRWCGRLYAGRRTVTRPDGSTRRVNRFRNGCRAPRETTARVTVTFAAEPTP